MSFSRIALLVTGVLFLAACTSNSSDKELNLLAPEIVISGNGQAITPNDTTPSRQDGTNFGAVEGVVVQSFVIENTGNTELQLSDGSISLNGSAAFSIAAPPSDFALAPNETASFDIQLDTTTLSPAEEVSAEVQVNGSNISSTFTFALSGIQGSPFVLREILDDGSRELAATGSTIDYGIQNMTATRNFVIENLGDEAFSILSFGLSDSNGANGDFSVSALSDDMLSPDEEATFSISYTPSYTAEDVDFATVTTAQINIDSSLVNSTSYNLLLSAQAQSPLLSVTGQGFTIPNGDDSPITNDGTRFGLTSESITQVFSLVNAGNTELFLAETDTVSISNGDGNGAFRVTTEITDVIYNCLRMNP